MKFKNSQHNDLYRDAVKAINAQQWTDAITQLQTLNLFLTEGRDKANAAHISALITRLQNPAKRLLVLAEFEAREAEQAARQFHDEITTLEKAADNEYQVGAFYQAAIDYGVVADKVQNNPAFKMNYADAIWNQANAYESLAHEIRTTVPAKAMQYFDKAIVGVRSALTVYIELDSQDDIDVCTQKLVTLKKFKDDLQVKISEELAQSQLFARFVEATQAYLKEVPLRSSADGIDILLSLRNTPTYITCPRQKSPALVETTCHGYDSQPEADEKPKM